MGRTIMMDRPLGSVEILGRAASKSEKQIPHPAQTAGIRDDKAVRNSKREN
jgi:hypothetical protein